jgi:phosphoenolpyruvate carboxykinase (GTP)
MLIPPKVLGDDGWEVTTVGDDIAWIKPGDDGRIYAINPEAGFFGVAPGTGANTNPNAVRMLAKNTIFTNCALTDDGDVWWEGLTKEPPAHAVDWRGNDWTPDSDAPAAHPNSRFTVAAAQAPSIAPEWEDPAGVPIDAIMFGGRRSTVVPLVTEATDWDQGVFLGASMSSEKTAAAAGNVGELRFDPFAMLPFCGYNMADYFGYWLSLKEREAAQLPRLFYVNWFRKDSEGKFLWPGFGDNIRVLAWIFRRCDDKAEAEESLLGLVPADGQIDIEGLDVSEEDMRELRAVDPDDLRDQIPQMKQHFAQFGQRLPKAIAEQMDALEQRLSQI